MVEEVAPVEGWAVIENQKINVRTVSPTRRAATINWLVVNGCGVFAHQTDDQIEEMFRERQGEAFVARVSCRLHSADDLK